MNLKDNYIERVPLLMQFIRFALVGLSNTVVSYVINISVLYALKDFKFRYDYVVANIVAFILSVLWSFYWNDRIVFPVGQGEKRSKAKSLLKTYVTYGFSGLILNNILATVWIYDLGMSKFISPLLNLPFTIPINFLMNKMWAYKKSA